MKALLQKILPKLAPDFREFEHWLVIEHEGKSDLEKSFPLKVPQWQEPGVRFIILRDNDGGDCRRLKARLLSRLPANPPDYLIRIVCQELESWLIGDKDALQTAYPNATNHGSFRRLTQTDPDTLNNASALVGQFTGTAAKTIRAAKIATQMVPNHNRSTSFQVFCQGVEQFRLRART